MLVHECLLDEPMQFIPFLNVFTQTPFLTEPYDLISHHRHPQKLNEKMLNSAENYLGVYRTHVLSNLICVVDWVVQN